MMRPRVSCVCPTYGRVTCLGEALDSFLLQTYSPRELVILNDAPTRIEDVRAPGIRKVCRLDCGGGHWVAPDGADVIVVNLPLQDTLGDKYNALLTLASGDVVCHWEDDDLFFPNHVETAVARLLADPGLACVKNERAWVIEKWGPQASWKYAGFQGNYFEGQMVFWREAAREIGYEKSHQRQSIRLLDGFRARGTLAEYSIHPWNTYIYRWDTCFLHGQLIATDAWTIEKWRDLNRDFESILTRRSCAAYMELVLRDLDAATAKPALSTHDAALVRGWLGWCVRGASGPTRPQGQNRVAAAGRGRRRRPAAARRPE